MALSASELLAIGKASTQEVPLNGVGTVHVGLMTVGDRDDLDAHRKEGVIPDFRARYLMKVLRNPDGSRMYAEADLPQLALLPEWVWDKVSEVSAQTDGLGEKALEEAVGNS